MEFLFNSQLLDLKRLLPWEQAKRKKKNMRGILEQKRRVLTEEQVATYSAQIIEQIEHYGL